MKIAICTKTYRYFSCCTITALKIINYLQLLARAVEILMETFCFSQNCDNIFHLHRIF